MKILIWGLLLLPLVVVSGQPTIYKAAKPQYPAKPVWADWLPAGYAVLELLEADFSNNGAKDIVMVAEKTDRMSCYRTPAESHKILIIALYEKESGRYDVVESETFLNFSNSQMNRNRFESVKVVEGDLVFAFTFEWSSGIHRRTDCVFTFRYIDGVFGLVKDRREFSGYGVFSGSTETDYMTGSITRYTVTYRFGREEITKETESFTAGELKTFADFHWYGIGLAFPVFR
ncbi:MAG: hypothetical protein LUE26_02975 [Alistipes sp.]|nr:hypothetical protein [Alistipes sp.]